MNLVLRTRTYKSLNIRYNGNSFSSLKHSKAITNRLDGLY